MLIICSICAWYASRVSVVGLGTAKGDAAGVGVDGLAAGTVAAKSALFPRYRTLTVIQRRAFLPACRLGQLSEAIAA